VPSTVGAVVRLLDDEALRARLGRAALEQAIESHSWDAHVGRILRALGIVTDPVSSSVASVVRNG
jgi:glycosyltransferase involved in cell wall biosynthesis